MHRSKSEPLRKRVQSALELPKRRIHKNWFGFCQHLTEEAVLFDRYFSSTSSDSSGAGSPPEAHNSENKPLNVPNPKKGGSPTPPTSV